MKARPQQFSTAVAEETQKLGVAITAVAQKFEQARALAESTKASNNAKRRLSELALEAETTEDFNNSQQFTDRIAKIKEEVSSSMAIPSAREDFQRGFERDSLATEFSIKNTLRKRQVDDAKEQMFENIELIEATSISREQELDLLLTKYLRAGIISPAEKDNLRRTTIEEWNIERIDINIEEDAEKVLPELAKGEEGIYANLPVKVRLTKEKEANTKIKRDIAIAERKVSLDYDTTENNLGKKINDGGSSIVEINKLEVLGTTGQPGGITGPFAEDARRLFNSIAAVNTKAAKDALPTEQEQIIAYDELTAELWNLEIDEKSDISEAPFEAIANFRSQVMRKRAKTLIDKTDGQHFIDMVANSYDQKTKALVRSKFKKGKIVHDAISFGSKRLPASQQLAAARFMNRLLTQRLLEEDIPEDKIDDVAREIFKEYVRKVNPGVLNLPEKGQKTVDTNGNVAKSFPDGSFEDSETKVAPEAPPNTPSFNSVSEANAAKLPKGTLILINGRKAVVE